MVIKSPWKDYYDFVAHQYGGGDPKVVYVRNRISPLEKSGFESNINVEMDRKFPLPHLHDLVEWSDRETKSVAYLVVAGKAYILMKIGDIYNDDVNTFRVQPIDYFEKQKTKRFSWWIRDTHVDLAVEHPFLIELSRKIKAPVFVIRDVYRKTWKSDRIMVKVAGQCPILREIGMPALIPAAQIYQELAYFVGNTMKEHPDTEPPVEVSNTSKILNAGFDLKQSFRHRM